MSIKMGTNVAKNCNNCPHPEKIQTFHSLRQLRLLKSFKVNKFYPIQNLKTLSGGGLQFLSLDQCPLPYIGRCKVITEKSR